MRNDRFIRTHRGAFRLSALLAADKAARDAETGHGSTEVLGDALRQADARIESRGRLVRTPISRSA